jgi:hypothetical protein
MTLIIQKPTGAKLNLAKTFAVQNYMWEFPAQYGLWSPANITTALWLDAADASTVTTDGSAVSQWNDKSSNARHASQVTASLSPTYTANGLNGKSVVTFNGSNVLGLTELTLGRNIGGLSYFAVASSTTVSGGNYRTIFDLNTGSGLDRASFYVRESTIEVSGRRLDTNLYQAHTNGTPSINTAFILCALFNYSAAALSVGFNGGALTSRSGGFQTAGNTSNTDSTLITMGASDALGSSTPFTGYVSEFIAIRSILSDANRQKLEGYLAHKWGLTANLPNDHPYKTVGPTP